MEWYYYKWNLLCDYTFCGFIVWGLATLMTLLLVKELDTYSSQQETNNNNGEFQRHRPSDFKAEIMLTVSHEWSQKSK